MIKIKEILVVEGRDDTAAIKKSVDAVTIETHGYGISNQTWRLIEEAYKGPGIIVFTDPDHAGEQIRRRILQRFPMAGQAFLHRDDATKKGNIGIENASPEAIEEALKKAHCTVDDDDRAPLTMEHMAAAGLAGGAGASEKRAAIGKKLGIGYANSKTFLIRLNKFGISQEELMKAARDL